MLLQISDRPIYALNSKPASNDNAVRHCGDEREGDEVGDDEKIVMQLDKISQDVQYMGVVMNSYSGQELNDVQNAKCHIFNSNPNFDNTNRSALVTNEQHIHSHDPAFPTSSLNSDCCFYDIDGDDSKNLDRTAFLFVVLFR